MSTHDPIDTTSLERARADREEKQRLTSDQEVADFKWLMSDKRGRRMVWGLFERAGLFRTSFTGNSETFFREGARNLGLYYLALIHKHCPEKYNLMVLEQKEHVKRHADNKRDK